MNTVEPEFSFRRILLALNASPHTAETLRAAVELAGKLDAELQGLFVEDISLLRLADFPGAREVLYFSATELPLTRARIEAGLRAQSEQARKALSAAAERTEVSWSFRTLRGSVTAELLAAAAQNDLLVVAGAGGKAFDRSPTVLAILNSTFPVLFLPERGLPRKPHLVVYYDGSVEARHALLAAAQLGKAGLDGVTLLDVSASKDDEESLERQVGNLKDRIDVEIRMLHATDPKNVINLLKRESSGILVLGNRKLIDQMPRLPEVLLRIGIPILLLS